MSPLYLMLATIILESTLGLVSPNIRHMFKKKFLGLRDLELGLYKGTGHDAITTLTGLIGLSVIPDPPAAYPVVEPVRLRLVSMEEVEHFIHFAAASYCDPKLLKRYTCGECVLTGRSTKLVQVFRNVTLDTLGFITINHVRRDIILTFRGTYNPTNLRSDAWVKRIKSPLEDGATLHEGFYEATMSLYRQVSHLLKQTLKRHPKYRVVITGHSLGGSMATMMLYFLTHYMPDINYALVSYGAPRGGDQRFADIINSKSIQCARVVNNHDIAPHVTAWSEGYFHHGNEYWINKGRIRVCSNEVYEDTTCSASLPRQKLIFADHVDYFGTRIGPLGCINESPVAGVLGILTG